MSGTAAATSTATGRLTSISLKDEAERVGLSVDDEIKRGDQRLRGWMVGVFIGATILGDIFTFIVVVCLSNFDQGNIKHALISSGGRIITSQVVMTLLGATTVQVGVIAAIIARYLFPSRADGK